MLDNRNVGKTSFSWLNSASNARAKPHLPPVPLAGRARGRHLCFLLTFLQLLSGENHLAGVITAFWTVPAKHGGFKIHDESLESLLITYSL